MTPPVRKHRRTVEIYFVLYLAALLLLLPDENHGTKDNSSSNLFAALLQTTFSIVPENNYITARLQRNASGYTVLSIDSLNTIYPVGNVRDVRYEFVIEDKAIGEKLRLTADNANASNIFTITQSSSGEQATFAWRPLANERYNRTFTVHVTAKAKPSLPPALLADDNLRQQFEAINANGQTALTAHTQFDVVISFAGSEQNFASGTGRVDTVVALSSSAIPSASPTLNGEPVLDIELKTIDAFAGWQWSNKARLYNLSLRDDVAEKPRIVFPSETNHGTAFIDDIDMVNNTVILKGTAPTSGIMRVQLITRRVSDNTQVRVEFVVRPTAMTIPTVPSVMYAEQPQYFNPRLPLLTNQTLSAVLYEGEKERYVSEQGMEFTFTPKEEDIGKKLTFVRLVNDKKVGETYTVRVIDYPLPRIIDIHDERDRLIVKTQAFGPKNNLGKRISITAQNLQNCRSPREIYGDYTYDSTAQAHVQVFQLTKIDPSQSASCTIIATDQRNRSSEPFVFGK